MNYTKHDKYLLDKIMQDKKRYEIIADNDSVRIKDRQDEEEHWITFDQYGNYFIVSLLQYLGFDADFV
ncbi:hypothetical protein [Paenibacillus oleatilyticus]|uniref:hypothetical protein n=1 Tax=Paenibacillus oleatilyticus TaxID=2594886 RepID=UPI001C1F2BE0|nr:hypothetical protein [Paenibacillus oleatilyticus]MBU7316019.1 hypothetical protein [Paenibacillus oleatilyticus]